MTPTKDALETGTASADSQLSQTKNRTKPESPHLRADAVSLEVPIKVHGSLVPNLSAGASPQAQPFEEQTTTMIVFPQGGVLKMSTGVSAGQVMALTNLKSRQDAICRVIKVRAYGKTQSYVEVEFTSPQPAFWGVYFPSDGPEVARMATPPPAEQAAVPGPAATETIAPPAPPAPVVPAAAAVAETRAPEPVAPAPPVTPPVPVAEAPAPSPAIAPSARKPKLPESAFASIGTQEDFLPPASVNKVPRASSFVNAASAKPPASMDSDISDAIDAMIAPSITAARTSSKAEAPKVDAIKLDAAEREVSAAPSAAEAPAARSVSVMTPKAASEQALPMPKQMFGVSLDSASPVATNTSQGSGGKAMAIIGIAALLAAAAGGAYYFNVFHLRSVVNRYAAPSAAASAVAAPASQPAVALNSPAPLPTPNANGASLQIPDQSDAGAQPNPATPQNGALNASSSSDANLGATEPTAAEPRIHTRQSESLAERREKAPSPTPREDRAAAPSQPSVAIPSTFGALNSRPVVRNQSSINSTGAAPALEPDGSPAPMGSALSGIAPPPPQLAAPAKAVSRAPVRVGGKLQPPRLISSSLPVYPAIAQQAGVTGTVVIDTTIDTNGRVEKMRVVSGPALLRGAALDALRKWKYEPSLLNGEPVAVQLVVSIQFH